MTKYYRSQKSDFDELRIASEKLLMRYQFVGCAFREQPYGIRMRVRGDKSLSGTSSDFDVVSLKPTEDYKERLDKNEACIKCTDSEKELYLQLHSDTLLSSILRLYKKIKPKAMQISRDGIFISFGKPLKLKFSADSEGGIFLPFGEEIETGKVLKQIRGENAYLIDRVID